MRSRPRASLSANLESHLTAYVVAGAGLLTFVRPVQGEVIYTPADQDLAPNTLFQLDINHDGLPDFNLANHSTSLLGATPMTGGSAAYLSVKGVRNANQPVRIKSQGRFYAAALAARQSVGPPRHFFGDRVYRRTMERCFHSFDSGTLSYGGPWKDVQHRFLGLKFKVNGELHFAWARFRVTADECHLGATLTGYAYETIARKPIVTGDKGAKAGLGHLALGAVGRQSAARER